MKKYRTDNRYLRNNRVNIIPSRCKYKIYEYSSDPHKYDAISCEVIPVKDIKIMTGNCRFKPFYGDKVRGEYYDRRGNLRFIVCDNQNYGKKTKK